MLLGASGTGKTTAIKTWIAQGITPFCVFTEPSYEVIGDIPCPKLHWHYIPPMAPDWSDMIDSATKINTLSFETLSGLSDIKKGKYNQFIDLLKALSSFTCDRCGKNFGAVDNWSTDRVIVLDSLSGLNLMAMNLVVGSKPVKSMANWGVAMDNEERLIQKLTVDKKCHFMLTAHIEREVDEVSGGLYVVASALGRKMAPKLPRFFSDVVLAKREITAQGAVWTWSTVEANVDLKARNLPNAAGLAPNIAPIIASWKSRGGRILSTA